MKVMRKWIFNIERLVIIFRNPLICMIVASLAFLSFHRGKKSTFGKDFGYEVFTFNHKIFLD